MSRKHLTEEDVRRIVADVLRERSERISLNMQYDIAEGPLQKHIIETVREGIRRGAIR